ncbi:MAG: N-acetylmuramoyl-L-alanine amidase [Oscillospiraceae bacterium]|jgi:LysM repeat protein|nr:N-acetylmuramoyl-L-alanine amidase [Oscillospiraceae bacterium]
MAEATRKIAIFAGHGGKDPGACSGKWKEKDCTLAVANQVAKLLRARGWLVVQNRTGDTDSGVNEKWQLANAQKVDAVVDIHLNAGGGTGTEIWYGNTRADSKALALKLQTHLVKQLGTRDRGVKNDKDCRFGQFGICKYTTAPSVLAELCFIDSADDMARFDAELYGVALADALIGTPPPATAPTTPSATAFAVGDKVELIGAYAASAYVVGATHKSAIGRTLVVGKIYPGAQHPYRVDAVGGVAIGFAAANALKKVTQSASGGRTYTVVQGDSLWRIAQKLLGAGPRYPEIVQLNPGSDKMIHPGDVLKIPV